MGVARRASRTVASRPCAEGVACAGLGGSASVSAWFASRGWAPFVFQTEAWSAYAEGLSGLIHVPTGAGKTYAAFGGPLAGLIDEARACGGVRGSRVLYVSPLRAVSRDIELALRAPIVDLGIDAAVESRTGDTSSSVRSRQRGQLPAVLVTTPESLSLMLTWDDAAERFAGLGCVVVDEWHELIASKRGTQTELALGRLRGFAPGLRTWALSATFENIEEAARCAAGERAWGEGRVRVIGGAIDRPIEIRTIVPSRAGAIPWAGHLGLSMVRDVIESLDPSRSTLLFTNTRSQAELWHQALLAARPEWSSIIGLHHGSVDREERERLETGLKDGSVRLVVATSSLDLGVDFAPVEEVYQVGSPKGISRLMQRAGRSGHRPGLACRVTCVPTHGLELVEIDAVRRSIAAGRIEPRTPPDKPLDVLAQHLVTCGMGGGFVPDALFEEVRGVYSYRGLQRDEFDWVLRMVKEGGATLWAYPAFHKLRERDGRLRVADDRIARTHRLNIGTIVSEATMSVSFMSGKRLGSIEENFISGMRPGTRFLFAGRVLELVRVRELTAYVRPAPSRTNFTPHWSGTRLPISESLGGAVRESLGVLAVLAPGEQGCSAELEAASEIARWQGTLSVIPGPDELLIETCETREGRHLFVYPFDGRLVHLGLAAVLSLRLSRRRPATFGIAANDYGFELLTGREIGEEDVIRGGLIDAGLFEAEGLMEDAAQTVNLAELSRAQFREVARVAGLVFPVTAGSRKSARQVNAGSSLMFDVFSEFDPGNLFLVQARREVMERQFERGRLARTMDRLRRSVIRIVPVARPTPLGFPLVLERAGGTLSSRSILERVEAMRLQWERTG